MIDRSSFSTVHPTGKIDLRQLSSSERVCLGIAVSVLVGCALFFRIWRLDHVPGVNGDEAWYGVRALQLLDGELPLLQMSTWTTPTGNPLNPFYIVPCLLIAWVMDPSVVALRMPALLSGLAALALNYALCRRVLGVSTAALSTGILAVLPASIAYGRFGWDASQTLLAAVPLVYLAISIPDCEAPVRRIGWACGALAAAMLVHPTNVFLLPILFVHSVWPWLGTARERLADRQHRTAVILAVCVFACVLMAGGWVFRNWLQVPIARILSPEQGSVFVLLLSNLFSGVTVYQFISGALRPDSSGHFSSFALAWQMLGVMLGLFVAWLVYQRLRQQNSQRERRLALGLLLSVLAFYAIAGLRGLTPGFERYAMWLLLPVTLLTSQVLSEHFEKRPRRVILGVLAFATVSLAGFYLNYLGHFYGTGGTAHYAFRTSEREPKVAAYELLRNETSDRASNLEIIAYDWWTYWPLRYLAFRHAGIHVQPWDEYQKRNLLPADVKNSRAFVSLADIKDADFLNHLSHVNAAAVDRRIVRDYSGNSVIIVTVVSEK